MNTRETNPTMVEINHPLDIGDKVNLLNTSGQPTALQGVIIGELTLHQKAAFNVAANGSAVYPNGARVFLVYAEFGENRQLDVLGDHMLALFEPDHSRN